MVEFIVLYIAETLVPSNEKIYTPPLSHSRTGSTAGKLGAPGRPEKGKASYIAGTL
jgi:hypothetical protein